MVSFEFIKIVILAYFQQQDGYRQRAEIRAALFDNIDCGVLLER
jgi:hypothetical protein|tara:strand:+ start:203 stop:334 length:132 start_codon:yes stop_codon:yes gene_type:complete